MAANNRRHRTGKGPRLSRAEICGITALTLAALLALWRPGLAVVPLTAFVGLCFAAPFLPRFPFYVDTISRGRAGIQAIALTFDDGPFPASTPLLLDLLARYRLTATFFVVGRQAAAHPDLIAEILAGGHSIGNHSYHHNPCLMLHSPASLFRDLDRTQEILAAAGVRPLVFRPPVGIVSPALVPVLARMELQVVNFSCRALDRGNRNTRNLAARVLRRLRPGDILLLHDIAPADPAQAAGWQRELDLLFRTIAEQHRVLPLEEVIGQPVMAAVPARSA